MTEFDGAYWREQMAQLDSTNDVVVHVAYARFISDHYRNSVRFVPGQGWYQWAGTHWLQSDDNAPAFQVLTKAAYMLARQSDERGGISQFLAAGTKLLIDRERRSVVREMQNLDAFRIRVADLNPDPFRLNFLNGTVNLHTAELHPHNPDDAITYVVEYDYKPDADNSRWLNYLESSQPNDPEMHTFLQRLAGYGLTGSTKEECLAFFYGSGANGKGCYTETLRNIFAPVVTTQNNDFWEKGKHERSGALIAKLHGARMVFSSEMSAARLDEIFLKSFVGADTLTANPKHKKPYDFTPTALLFLSGNDKPTIVGTDDGIWRRFKCVPWDESFVGRKDKELKPDLLKPEHAEGVISWCVAGAAEWIQHGLNEPARVSQATEEYREESDPFAEWLEENFEADPDGFVTAAEIEESTRHLRLPGSKQKHKAELVKFFGISKDNANYRKKIGGSVKRVVLGVRRVEQQQQTGPFPQSATRREDGNSSGLRIIPTERPAM